jgi:hypothetical protein
MVWLTDGGRGATGGRVPRYVRTRDEDASHTAECIAPSMVIPEVPIIPQVNPDVELVAKAERFKRQRDNMEKKLIAAKEEICGLQDSRAHIRENLDIFKADYRLKCDECNWLELYLQVVFSVPI